MTRQIRTALCTAFVVGVTAGGAEAASQGTREATLLHAINDVRAAHGLRPLQPDLKLVRAARANSVRMLRTNLFTHGAFRARIATYGARGPVFGENMAWGVGSRGRAGTIVRAWLASPGHRSNLLRPGFRRVGVGASVGRFAGNRRAVVVTATFAGR